MHIFLNYFAKILKGDSYQLDPTLKIGPLIGLAWRRSIFLIRGLIVLRKMVFVGSRVNILNKRYLTIGRGVTIQDGALLDALSKNGIKLGDNCNIGPMTVIQATGVLTRLGTGLTIGSNSGIGGFSFIGCGGGVSIGSNVIMGQYVSFHSENHIFENIEVPIRTQGVTRFGISIGDDCWVGAKATFLDGVNIGRGCVIAAGSVVRNDIPPFSIAAGVPARVIRSRLNTPATPIVSEDAKCVL